MKTKRATMIFFLVAFFLSSFSLTFALSTWEGYVYITNATGTNLTAEDNTIVQAYVNDVLTNTVRVREVATFPAGYYSISLDCNVVDNVTFRVWGVNITGVNTSAQPCKEGVHQSFHLNMSTLAAGGSCTYSKGCTGGYCCSGATEYANGEGTGTCQASACSAATTTTAAGGGGGGGGGGAAALAEESTTLTSIAKNKAATFGYAKSDDLGIQQIKVTATVDASNVKITVKETSWTGTAAVPKTAGSTYKYLTITPTNIKSSEVGKTVIKFKVSRAWINDNNIDPDTVKLKKHKEGKWNVLPTKKIKSDADYYYYEAETTQLSIYAITGEKKTKLTATDLLDMIRDFYAGKSKYTALELLDKIRAYYGG
jgi:PGF-pre-PGF domain-containing protein